MKKSLGMTMWALAIVVAVQYGSLHSPSLCMPGSLLTI